MGARAGINFAKLGLPRTSESGDLRTNVGLNIGGFAAYDLTDEVIIQPELAFSQKGGEDYSDGGWYGGMNDLWFDLSYLDLAVLFVAHFGGAIVSPRLFAGPRLSYLLSASMSRNGEPLNIDGRFKNFDFGLALGVGLDFQTALGAVTMDARFDGGLISIDTRDYETTTSTMMLLAGYSY